MASQASLIGLPVEVFNTIVGLLDFFDICNLRLTARELLAKAFPYSFKARFVTKSVHLSREHLRNFHMVTQRDWKGCALQHLTIIGFVSLSIDDSHEVHEQENVELLNQALKNLRVNSIYGRLFSLTLVIKCRAEDDTLIPTGQDTAILTRPNPEWHHIWQCAGDTARLTALAVQFSAIPVERLDLYGTIPRRALSSHQLGSTLDIFEMHELKSLSLAVSANESRDVEDAGLSEHIRRLIVSLPELEHLAVRFFDIDRLNSSDAEREERRFFDRVVELSIPRLTSVSLKGIHTSENALLSFLSKHPHLRQISFEQLRLEQGEFRPVFAYINEHLELDSLYLNDLWGNRLIQFPGSPGKGHLFHPGGPSWLKRTGAETREMIVHRPWKGYMKDSPQSRTWHRRRAYFYGPP